MSMYFTILVSPFTKSWDLRIVLEDSSQHFFHFFNYEVFKTTLTRPHLGSVTIQRFRRVHYDYTFTIVFEILILFR